MPIRIQSITAYGSSGLLVDIECHLSNNLPNIVIVGYANKAVDESRERIRGAFATSRIMLPRKRVIINLAPADIPKADSGFDVAIAVAILQANGQLTSTIPQHSAFIGELGLDGSIRAVRGIIGKVLVGRDRGISTFYIPAANLAQAQLVPHVQLIAVANLGELYAHLTGLIPIDHIDTGNGSYAAPTMSHNVEVGGLHMIVGQAVAKRALEVAAAGGHNILLSGPPGTGKSMLAKAMPSILPPLTREEVLEVTHLHSLASHNYEQIIDERPFRAPHHSASSVAVTGGGGVIRPGELSLAHRGVLFFDELPEFSRPVLESLRQPLEDRLISISRAVGSVDFPANFIMVATANPCPCGYHGSLQPCSCSATDMKHYQNRLSGPILDRIDLHCDVHETDHQLLLNATTDGDRSPVVAERVARARAVQAERLGTTRLNTDMTNLEVRQLARLTPEAISHLNKAAATSSLSARAYMRSITVARTIADLAGAADISPEHMKEALGYRQRNPRNKL